MEKRDSQRENMVLTLVLWSMVACVSLTAMLYVISRKTIVITDTVPEESNLSESR